MAFGDVGGPVTELIITCCTPEHGAVALRKNDAVVMTGRRPYEVGHAALDGVPVFGQVLADCDHNAAVIPVRVRGVLAFRYAGPAPLQGTLGLVVSAEEPGKVQVFTGSNRCWVCAVRKETRTVEVLL